MTQETMALDIEVLPEPEPAPLPFPRCLKVGDEVVAIDQFGGREVRRVTKIGRNITIFGSRKYDLETGHKIQTYGRRSEKDRIAPATEELKAELAEAKKRASLESTISYGLRKLGIADLEAIARQVTKAKSTTKTTAPPA